MPIDIDGFAVLGAISRHPDYFSAIKNDASKTARMLVIKQLKEKTLSLGNLIQIASSIEHNAFELIIDLMSETEIKALVIKIDKHNFQAKAETAKWRREHIASLVKGEKSPSDKPPKAPKTAKVAKEPKPPKPPVERAVNSKAMRARKKPESDLT